VKSLGVAKMVCRPMSGGLGHGLRAIGRLLASAALATSVLGQAAGAQSIDRKLWAVEPTGRVLAIARAKDTIYIGGNFHSVGPVTGQGVPVDTGSGAPLTPYPQISGTVEAVIGDGQGGWFIGGGFTSLGGIPRHNLAHILADGTVSSWTPEPNGRVRSLCLSEDTLFVGGEFTSFAGSVRHRLAALDVHSTALTPWDPDADAAVLAILVDSSRVYLGGEFMNVGGQPHSGLAAVDRCTGIPLEWSPQADASVKALAVFGNQIYLGGDFTSVSGQSRGFLAAVDRWTGDVLPWNPIVERNPPCNQCDNGPFVATLVAADTILYVGGSFTHIDGLARASLGAIDLNDQTITAWDPKMLDVAPRPYCFCLAVQGGIVYAGGSFAAIGDSARAYAGAVDALTGHATAWNPRPNQEVHAIAIENERAFMGGAFSSVWSWQPRHYLAALDASTGALTDWNPDADNMVDVLKSSGSTIYVTGAFTRVGGENRAGIAAIDVTIGNATAWNPGVAGVTSKPVWDLLVSKGVVYAAGWFTSIGGQSRYCLAAIDSATGMATPWDPNVDDIVECLGMQGDTLFIGGWFSSVGGHPQPYLAAIDSSGQGLSWGANVDDVVETLTLAQGRVYIGGLFTNVGGLPRKSLAAVDRSTGALSDWVVNTDFRVIHLHSHNDVVYVGGTFPMIGGALRNGLAAIDAASGSVLAWDPNPNSTVWTLYATDGAVYIGGGFDYIGGDPRPGLAAVAPAVSVRGPVIDPGHVLALSQNAPNPASTSTSIHFALSRAADVQVDVYDLVGRLIATPLKRQTASAGPHQIELRTDRWPSGVYYYRAEAEGERLTRKMVVLR
jgi:trimeric autotransporter adhesin